MRFMKIIVLLIICLSLNCIPSFANVRNVQDNYKFIYNIVDSLGAYVSGQNVEIKIQRASDGYFFDFNDSVFKASGWIDEQMKLSEDDVNGIYYYTFNPPASETSAEQYVFIVDNADATYGDHQAQLVNYQKIAGSVWDETNVCDSLSASQCLSTIKNSTDGDREGLDYSGIEKTIRAQR
jgi:hypothetical protein